MSDAGSTGFWTQLAQKALTGAETVNSIGRLIYELGVNRLTAARAAKLDKIIEDWRWNALENSYLVLAGTWAVTSNTTQYLGKYLENTSAAMNDAIALPFFARSASAVTLNVRGISAGPVSALPATGRAEIYIDNVLKGTIDFTNGTIGNIEYNTIRTLSITPARVGLQVLKLKSIDNLRVNISEIWLS